MLHIQKNKFFHICYFLKRSWNIHNSPGHQNTKKKIFMLILQIMKLINYYESKQTSDSLEK